MNDIASHPTHPHLYYDRGILTLRGQDSLDAMSLSINFLEGSFAHRRRCGQEGKKGLLGRACGLHRKGPRFVLDCTAGLGADALTLAKLGCTVLMTERCEILFALLDNALARAGHFGDEALLFCLSRVALLHVDGLEFLKHYPETISPDVIYLDPMYPEKKKSAAVKKELRLVRQVAGKDEDAPQLLACARQVALERVVVKRMRKAPFLGDITPNTQVMGKTTRYDIYLK